MEKFAKYSPIASRLDGYAVSCLVMCAHDQAKTRKKFYGFKFYDSLWEKCIKYSTAKTFEITRHGTSIYT